MNFKSLTLAIAATLALGTAQAQSLSLSPDSKTVDLGTSFSLDVLASDFANPILGGGFELSFDPSVLRLDSVVIPASWEFARSGGLIDNASGTLSDAYFATFSAPKAGDFLTATLNFSAIGGGQSKVTLLPNALQPFVEDVTVAVIDPVYKSAQITVTAIPEARAVALLLAGAGVMVVVGSQRRRQSQG